MKLLVIFVAILGVSSAQRSPFVDYVLDLQYAVGFIHTLIQDITWQSRDEVSGHLTAANEDGVFEIFNALNSVISIRNSTDTAIEAMRGTGNYQCIEDINVIWQEQPETVGAAIGTCGNQHMDTMYSHVTGYHQYLNSHRQLKFDAQNIVLKTFTEVNPMTHILELSGSVEQGINDIWDHFEANVQPEMIERTSEFANLSTDIPAQIRTCVAAAIETFSNIAAVTVEAVQNC